MDIIELALAYWRLKRWVDKVEVDKKLSAYNSLKKIGKYLENQGVQLIGYDGQSYDIGLRGSVAGDDGFYDCDEATIAQTIEPVILIDKEIVHYGIVVLKKENEN